MKSRWSIFLFLLLSVVVLIAPANVLIAPSSPNINYYGRFTTTDPEKPRFNWSGATIEASFPGPTIGMRLEHSNAYYDVEIDGMHDTVIATGSAKDFIFKSNLSLQTHTVRIRLRSEDHYSAGTFLGLYLADGKELIPLPAKPVRKIEFIGDSYTAGYGIESASRTCNPDELKKFTNANKTFAALMTRAFHAQSIMLGWSGAGVVRNYGEAAKRSPAPYPSYYDKTIGEVYDGGVWDYTKWKPDLVVICLGTNDYSTTPHPDDSMYIGDYHKFITRVLGNYPAASILCVSTGDATFEKNVKQVVSEETTTLIHPNVYFAPYPPSRTNAACDWHPSIDDNKAIAQVLIDTVMKKLGWDTTAAVATISPRASKNIPQLSVLSGKIRGGRFEITLAKTYTGTAPISLISIRGEELSRITPDNNNRCSFTMDHFGPGMYMAGNKRVGWVTGIVR